MLMYLGFMVVLVGDMILIFVTIVGSIGIMILIVIDLVIIVKFV